MSRQLKKWKIFEGFAEYLKNGSTDFYQTYVILRQLSLVSFEIKRLKTGHLRAKKSFLIPCCRGNQSMRECWAKIMMKEEKSGIFLKIMC